jgi:hypothetical protein
MNCHYILPLVKHFFAAQGVGMLSPLHATEMTGQQSIACGGKRNHERKTVIINIFKEKS